MRTQHWITACLTAVLLTAMLAACGGDDEPALTAVTPTVAQPATTMTPTPDAQPSPTPTPDPPAAQPSATTTSAGGSYGDDYGEDDGSSATATPQPATTAVPDTTATAAPEPTAAPAIPTSATWQRLQPSGDLPAPRSDHSLVADADGSRVYLFGGRSAGIALRDLWVYHVVENRWEMLAEDGPEARFGHNAAFDTTNARVVIFGGQAGADFFSDIWVWDVAGSVWTQLAENNSGPLDRYGAGGGYDPATNRITISHGFTSSGRFDDTWAFDLDDNAWIDLSPAGERPEARCLHRMVADPARNRLLLFGGQSNSAPFLGDLWALDLAGGAWSRIDTPGPSPRTFYSMVLRADAGQVVLFGGNVGGSTGDTWVFDLATDTWTQLTGDGPARYSHDAVWLPGQGAMLVFGGNAGGDQNDLWLVTLD